MDLKPGTDHTEWQRPSSTEDEQHEHFVPRKRQVEVAKLLIDPSHQDLLGTHN
jgi:hypothetical protein